MGPDIDRLSLRMAAEIEGGLGGARPTAEQERHRRCARRASFESFGDGSAQSGGTVLFQQLQQLRCLRAGRFALCEGQVEKRPAFRRHLLQTSAGRRVEGLAFGFEYGVLMGGIEHV